MFKNLVSAVFIVGAIGLGSASAVAVTITATGEGWCESGGFCNNTNTSVIANTFSGKSGNLYRDWFAFDLTGASGSITSATLSIWNDGSNFNNVSGALYNLYQAAGISYSGLVSGSSLGDILTSVADTGVSHYVDITLNAAGLAALTAGEGSTFVFGGFNNGDQIFGYTGGVPIATLTYTTTVPEPGSMGLLGFGLLALAFAKRRKQKIA